MNYNFPTGHHTTRNTQTPIPTASNTEGTAPPITSRQPPRRHRLPLAAIVSLLPLSPDQHIAVDSRLRFSQRVRGGQDLLQAASITKTRFRRLGGLRHRFGSTVGIFWLVQTSNGEARLLVVDCPWIRPIRMAYSEHDETGWLNFPPLARASLS
jgi:hypothetical protein